MFDSYRTINPIKNCSCSLSKERLPIPKNKISCSIIVQSRHVWYFKRRKVIIPVAMDMAGTEGKAVVYQCGINHEVLLRSVQEIGKVAEVPVAATHAVSRTVLIQHKNLPWAEPPLKLHQAHQEYEIRGSSCLPVMNGSSYRTGKDNIDIIFLERFSRPSQLRPWSSVLSKNVSQIVTLPEEGSL